MALLENRFRRQKKRQGPLGIPYGPVRAALADFNPVIQERPKIFVQDLEDTTKRMHEERTAESIPLSAPAVEPRRNKITVRYCGECLQRHYSKAHGLLEEAERFSLKQGKLTREAAYKVRKAVEELVTSEDDIDTVGAPQKIQSKLNDIKDLMRDIRKQMWADNLFLEGASLDALKRAKEGVEELVRRNYDLMSMDKKRGTMRVDRSSTSEVLASGIREPELASGFLDTRDAAEAKKWIDKHLKKEECSICRDELREAKRLISKKKYGTAQDMINEIIRAYREIQSEVQ